jgi:hypothetical protein
VGFDNGDELEINFLAAYEALYSWSDILDGVTFLSALEI